MNCDVLHQVSPIGHGDSIHVPLTNTRLEAVSIVLSRIYSGTVDQYSSKLLTLAVEAILFTTDIGRLDLAIFILDHFCPHILEARFEKFFGCTLLCIAATEPNGADLVRHLIQERHCHALTPNPAFLGASAIHFAVTFNRHHTVDVLLECDPSLIDARDWADRTPLCVAAEYGNVAITQQLIVKHGADPFCEAGSSIAICFAIDSGRLNVVKYLLNHDRSMLHYKDDDGETLLARAAMSSFPEAADIIQHLVIVEGIDVDERDSAGFTPLQLAAMFGETPSIMETLVNLGADIEAKIADTCQDIELQGKTIFDLDFINENAKRFLLCLKHVKRSKQHC